MGIAFRSCSLLLVAASLTVAGLRGQAAAPLPSEQLQAYSANNLEHLLGPLNEGALPRAELMKLEIDYKGRLGLAAPGEKAVLQAALEVCTAFGKIMDERAKAVAAVSGAEAQNSNAQGSTKLHARKKDEFSFDQKRREIREGQSDSNFIASAALESANRAWKLHQQPWREATEQLLVREKQAEVAMAAGPVPAGPATASSASSAGPTPATGSAAPAPPAAVAHDAAGGARAAEEKDPVVGQWMMESGSSLTLEADHSISGDRHGMWAYKGANDKGRNYELHWNPPKDWIDYLVLSSDGNSLNGHTRGSKAMSVYRQ